MSKTNYELFYRSHETPDFVRWFETDNPECMFSNGGHYRVCRSWALQGYLHGIGKHISNADAAHHALTGD